MVASSVAIARLRRVGELCGSDGLDSTREAKEESELVSVHSHAMLTACLVK
jgi:hypothetical protein